MTEWLHSLRLKMKAAFSRKRLERDLDDELAFHLAMKEENADGRRFGNPAALKESLRDAWTFAFLESLIQDARHAVRGLRKAPGFTAIAVLSLAVGIGANTSIFTVFNTLFLRSLPVTDPQDLRIVMWTGTGKNLARQRSGYSWLINGVTCQSSFSWEAFQEIRKQPVFSSAAGFAGVGANLVAGSQARVAEGYLVTGNYFQTLGLQPALGRALLPADDNLAAPPVVVISWKLFEQLYGGDPNAVGSPLLIDQTPYTVVGVLPPDFTGIMRGERTDLFLPVARADPRRYSFTDVNYWWLQVVARVAPGVDDSQVRAALDVTLQQIVSAHQADKPDPMKSVVMDGSTGPTFLIDEMRRFLLTLLVMVGVLLLIACANVANLLIARGSARYREIAIRQSLGAGRKRVVRYLLTESVILGLLGGGLGLLLAQAGTVALSWMLFPDPERSPMARPDGTVLAFTGLLSLATAVLFGLIPAWRSSGVQPASFLKQAGSSAGALRQRLARSLVVVQVALALVLVAGAGLFARTLANLHRIDIGFRPDHLLLFRVDPARNGYTEGKLADLYRRIEEKLAALPGVRTVMLTRTPLLSGHMSSRPVVIPEYQPKPDERPGACVHYVSGGFLTNMGAAMLPGRDLQRTDDEHAPLVAVINSTMAKKYFTGNPVGRLFSFDIAGERPILIVGVSSDMKYDRLRAEIPPTVYLPWPQQLVHARSMNFQLRTSVPPESLMAAARQVVAEIDPTLPISEVTTQRRLIDRMMWRERNFALLSLLFSSVALLLACIGVYGVLAYAVTRRTSEFGIRLALGARSANIKWLVLRGTILLILIATPIGIAATLAATRWVESTLYGVKPTDPVTLLTAAIAIALAALIAAYIPSRRAARSDPAVALRYE